MIPQIVGNRLLIKPITLDEHDPTVASAKKIGIVLAEKTERQEATIISSGTVVQKGPNIQFNEQIEVGDRVDYVRHGGMFVHDPDNKANKWYVLNDDDVLVVWRKNE